MRVKERHERRSEAERLRAAPSGPFNNAPDGLVAFSADVAADPSGQQDVVRNASAITSLLV